MLIKVADFAGQVMEASASTNAMPTTLSGDVVGTVAYMFPRTSLRGGDFDGQANRSVERRDGCLFARRNSLRVAYRSATFVGMQPLEVMLK